jgi:hypothetical protein
VEAGVDDCASASRRVGLSHLCVWVDLRSPKKTVGRSAWSIMDEVGHHYLIDSHVRLIGPVAADMGIDSLGHKLAFLVIDQRPTLIKQVESQD